MKLLRSVLIALLLSLVAGMLIGTLLRMRLERPVRYWGSAPASLPLDVRDVRAPVLHAGHYEQQVREAIQVAERGRRLGLLAVEGHQAPFGAPTHGARHVEGRRSG